MGVNSSSSASSELLPIFLRHDRLQILMVGTGISGLEKLESILGNGESISVTVVVSFISQKMQELINAYAGIKIIQRPFLEEDLNEKDLVILAADDVLLNKHIKKLATSRGILTHVVNDEGLSDFYLGPIVEKGHLKIAISSKSQNPAIDKKVRQLLKLAMPAVLTEANRSLSSEAEKPWRRIVMYSLYAFAFMIIGHLVFSYIPFKAILDGTINLGSTLDKTFPIMLLAGFLAQLVDGALGMGYGVTSASILLSAGVNPAAISGSIHTAEMFASGASGYSHYKFGNVNLKLFKTLLIPGILGAIGGAVLLVVAGEKYGTFIRPVIAIYTLLLGVRFLINAFRGPKAKKKFRHYRVLAGIGGFFDSFAGGGWGPIVTSTLINTGRTHRFVIGSVSLTEFFVTLASAFTFFTLIGVSHWQTILGLIAGGFIAAPIAAKLAGKLPKKISYALLGILVIIWSIRILSKLL